MCTAISIVETTAIESSNLALYHNDLFSEILTGKYFLKSYGAARLACFPEGIVLNFSVLQHLLLTCTHDQLTCLYHSLMNR